MRLVIFSHPVEGAPDLVRRLVEERLMACGHLLPSGTSIYRWEGRIEEAPEVQVLCKTAAARVEELVARIRALHPYDLPEILTLPVEGGLEAYRAWVNAEVLRD